MARYHDLIISDIRAWPLLLLATEDTEDTEKKEYPDLPNKKLLEIQKPFLEKVFGRRRQWLTVNFGSLHLLFFFVK